MALLTENERVKVWREIMRDPRLISSGTLLKADIRAAVNGLDDFLENNWTLINQSIPQPARGELTRRQKAMLLLHVITERFNVEV